MKENRFGRHSKKEMVVDGVYITHPHMVVCVTYALTKCSEENIDFIWFDGGRMLYEQRENILNGVSKTWNSYHLPRGSMNICYAADLVPYIDGKPRWDSDDSGMQTLIDGAFASISRHMKRAGELHRIAIQNGFDLWGWDKPHWQLDPKVYDIPRVDIPVELQNIGRKNS